MPGKARSPVHLDPGYMNLMSMTISVSKGLQEEAPLAFCDGAGHCQLNLEQPRERPGQREYEEGEGLQRQRPDVEQDIHPPARGREMSR